MVNSALTTEDDIGLQAEVYHYRAGLKRECNTARELATLKYKYQRQRQDSWSSARHLAAANAYHRLYPDVLQEQIHEEGPPGGQQDVAVRQLTSTMWRPTSKTVRHCNWCQNPGHGTKRCSMIWRCLLCAKWGHLEEQCYQSHSGCDHAPTCRVPPGHPQGQTYCRLSVARDIRRG
jgi:hypothetical protein